MDFRLTLSEADIQDLKNLTGSNDLEEITLRALSLYKWAAAQQRQGLKIVSGKTDSSRTKITEIVSSVNLPKQA